MLHNDSLLVYFLVYVDDLIIIGNNLSFVEGLATKLDTKFSLKDLRPLHFFLSVEVIPKRDSMFLTQHKFICDLLA